MKLYNWQFAPNCRRVRMFLLEKGIDLPAISEVIGDGMKLQPDYIKMWPAAMVPLLELDDGTRISEALAIVRYFEDLHPEPNLLGATPVERAFVTMWERPGYDEGIVGTAEVARNSMEVFHNRALPGFGDEVVVADPGTDRSRQTTRTALSRQGRSPARQECILRGRPLYVCRHHEPVRHRLRTVRWHNLRWQDASGGLSQRRPVA